jgi:uncharacterized protein (TIGR00369 family)
MGTGEPEVWRRLRPDGTNIWEALGFRAVDAPEGRFAVEWDAGDEYTFPNASDSVVVHGGMVATLLDTAMGFACATQLGEGEGFLTADLHVEFYKPARRGLLRAEGRIVQRSRRVVFCAADLFDVEGTNLASARCTQIVRTMT